MNYFRPVARSAKRLPVSLLESARSLRSVPLSNNEDTDANENHDSDLGLANDLSAPTTFGLASLEPKSAASDGGASMHDDLFSASRAHVDAQQRLADLTANGELYLHHFGDVFQLTPTVRGMRYLRTADPDERQQGLSWLSQRAQLQDDVSRLRPAAEYEQQLAQMKSKMAGSAGEQPIAETSENAESGMSQPPKAIATANNPLQPSTPLPPITTTNGSPGTEKSPQSQPNETTRAQSDQSDQAKLPLSQNALPNGDRGSGKVADDTIPRWDNLGLPLRPISVVGPKILRINQVDYLGDPEEIGRALNFNVREWRSLRDQLESRSPQKAEPPTTAEKIAAVPYLFLDGLVNSALMLAAGPDYAPDALRRWGSPFKAARTLGIEHEASDGDIRQMTGAAYDLAYARGAQGNPNRRGDFKRGFDSAGHNKH